MTHMPEGSESHNKSMIAIESLTKYYKDIPALWDLSLNVKKGEVLGLLGPSGSGKTTTIRLILGLIRPTSGKATVRGYDCWNESQSVRELVSYLPGELRLYGSMTGLAILRFLSGLRGGAGLDRAVTIAEKVMKLDLSRRVRSYSTGMKQKLGLSQTFADPVDVLILDEPTSALDPSARQDVISLMADARAQGQTVIFSGHVLTEVEQVADRIAIMRLGQLMHVEDMHCRRTLRMILVRFRQGVSPHFPDELNLVVREKKDEAWLLEHHGELSTLIAWLSVQDVQEIAIGTEDIQSLYDRFHGADVTAEVAEVRS
ncbi:MAG: ATP-binding cassette domain-containing protein [Isosphaeraceae bacterium]